MCQHQQEDGGAVGAEIERRVEGGVYLEGCPPGLSVDKQTKLL